MSAESSQGEGKRIVAVFYVSEHGSEPVRKWLKEDLTLQQRKSVGEDLKTVEFNWPIGMPTVRKLFPDLWEVRTKFQGGIARVMFTVEADRMILLHGFVKKSNKTPKEELSTAIKRLSAYKGQRL
jgi:phage-related protein